MEKEEDIQHQMQETRDSLTNKLETLEHKVMDTVTEARTAVSNTVDSIKETVQGTVNTVNESVKEGVDTVKDWVDVKTHVQHHPWLMVGGSVAVGFGLAALLGRVLDRSSTGSSSSSYETSAASSYAAPTYAPAVPSAAPAEERSGPGPVESMLSTFQPEIARLKSLAVGALFGAAREMLLKAVPEHIGHQLKETIDQVTEKMGGDPQPSSDWASQPGAENPQGSAPQKGDATSFGQTRPRAQTY